ncbi:MAG: arginase family protein [Deltaproteobacteria bacterium]|nr:arginase family protein [Deltaproteobacteria bacterium]
MSAVGAPPLRYLLNPAVEAQQHNGGLVLKLPPWNRALAATVFQHGLLRCFDVPKTIAEVLAERPFQRAAAARFLDEAVQLGLLAPLDDDGALVLPPLVDVPQRFAHATAWDAAHAAHFVIVGAPLDQGVTGRAGARFGPTAMRDAAAGARSQVDPVTLAPVGFHDFASGRTLLKGVTLADAGDVLVQPGEPAARARARLTRVLQDVAQAGSVPFVLGGDHSITRATLEAVPEGEGPLHVLHLDAHTDLGEVVPGAGLHHGNVMSVVFAELPHVAGVHQLGLRGIYDAPTHAPHPKVRQLGVDGLRQGELARFLDGIPQHARCWLSLDIDVVDPAFAPSTGTPVPGGLLPHEVKAIVEAAARARRFVGGEVVEVAEPLGPADATAGVAVSCMFAFLQGMVDSAEAAWPTRRTSPTRKSSPRSSRSPSRRRSPSR